LRRVLASVPLPAPEVIDKEDRKNGDDQDPEESGRSHSLLGSAAHYLRNALAAFLRYRQGQPVLNDPVNFLTGAADGPSPRPTRPSTDFRCVKVPCKFQHIPVQRADFSRNRRRLRRSPSIARDRATRPQQTGWPIAQP